LPNGPRNPIPEVSRAGLALPRRRRLIMCPTWAASSSRFFFFKQKTAYEIGLGIPAEPLFRSNKTRDGLIRVRNIRALNGRFNTSITHAYSIVIGSKHITLNATGGGFLTASKQFRHGATSKSRSNTASNSTKHKSPHLSGW